MNKVKKFSKIKCRLCERIIGRNSIPSHLKSHGVRFEDYKLQYLEDFPDWGYCEICGKLTRKSGGVKQKGLTCSFKCRGIRNGKIAIETGRWKNENNPMKKESIRKKVSKTRKEQGNPWKIGIPCKEETKQKIGKANKGKLAGENNPMYGKKHTPDAIRKIFKMRPMNKFERKVADLLESEGIKYHFQFFINEGDLCKSYDFKIKGKNIIIEADGDYWHGGPGLEKYHGDVLKTQKNDEVKTKLAESRGYKVIRIWESEFNKKVLDQLFIKK